MRERPIIFSGPMVRAILDGQKTQTRRVVTRFNSTINGPACERKIWDQLCLDDAWVDPGPSPAGNTGPYIKAPFPRVDGFMGYKAQECVYRVYPRIQPGDRLWVRETWRSCGVYPDNGQVSFEYRAGGCGFADKVPNFIKYWFPDKKWRPSIHMPRWASRITLEVTGVRVERLQEISGDDCEAEGVCSGQWVWVVSFTRIS